MAAGLVLLSSTIGSLFGSAAALAMRSKLSKTGSSRNQKYRGRWSYANQNTGIWFKESL